MRRWGIAALILVMLLVPAAMAAYWDGKLDPGEVCDCTTSVPCGGECVFSPSFSCQQQANAAGKPYVAWCSTPASADCKPIDDPALADCQCEYGAPECAKCKNPIWYPETQCPSFESISVTNNHLSSGPESPLFTVECSVSDPSYAPSIDAYISYPGQVNKRRCRRVSFSGNSARFACEYIGKGKLDIFCELRDQGCFDRTNQFPEIKGPRATARVSSAYVCDESPVYTVEAVSDTYLNYTLIIVDGKAFRKFDHRGKKLTRSVSSATLSGLSEGTHLVGAEVMDYYGNKATVPVSEVVVDCGGAPPGGNGREDNRTSTQECSSTMHGYVFRVGGSQSQQAWVAGSKIRCSNSMNDYIATSGQDGYYSIQGMECGKYTCSASKDGLKTAYAEVVVGDYTKRKDFYLWDDPGTAGKLSGYVFNAEGGAIAGAYVKCDNGYFSTSDADGYYEINDMDAGSYTCSASKEGFKTAYKSVIINPGEDAKANFYLFKKPGSASPGPQDSTQQPSNYPIYIGPPVVIIPRFGAIAGVVREYGSLVPLQEASINCKGYTTFTNVFGRYRIDGVPEGSYLCTAEKPGYERESITVFVSPGVTSRADFTLQKTRDCMNDVYVRPGEYVYEGPENTFDVIVYDRSTASCGNAVEYSIDYEAKGACRDVMVEPQKLVMLRGGHKQVSVYISPETGRTCTVDMKVYDTSGRLRAFGSYTVYSPKPDFDVNSVSVYGPERVETGQEFTIYAEAFDISGIKHLRIYWDGNLEKACSGNTCSIKKVVYEEGSHTYYSEAVDSLGNIKRSRTAKVTVIDVSPSTGSLKGVVRNEEASPVPAALVSCAGSTSQSDSSGEYYFVSLPAGEVECTVSADGYAELTESVYISPGIDNTHNFILQKKSESRTSPTAMVEARIVKRADIVQSPWYWAAKYIILIALLVLLVILVIYYVSRRAALREEEELLRELEKYK